MLFVFTTVSDENTAAVLAGKLVEAKLAACVQILPAIRSIYIWKGEICNDAESLLLIKTSDEKYDEVESFIKANHHYETPEIAAVSVEKVSNEYAEWLVSSLGL